MCRLEPVTNKEFPSACSRIAFASSAGDAPLPIELSRSRRAGTVEPAQSGTAI